MDKRKCLSLILEVNKSLWNYWRAIDSIFKVKEEMGFLDKEITLGGEILNQIIGYSRGENNISHDLISNAETGYYYHEKGIEETITELLKIEDFLKEINTHKEFNPEKIIEDLVDFYLYLEEVNNSLKSFLKTNEISLIDDLLLVIELIKSILDLEIDEIDRNLFVNIIYDQLMYKDIEKIKEVLISTSKLFN